MSDVVSRERVLKAIVVIKFLQAYLVHDLALRLIAPPYSVVLLVPRYIIIIIEVGSTRYVVRNTICVDEASDCHVHIGVELPVIAGTLGDAENFQVESHLVCIKQLALIP